MHHFTDQWGVLKGPGGIANNVNLDLAEICTVISGLSKSIHIGMIQDQSHSTNRHTPDGNILYIGKFEHVKKILTDANSKKYTVVICVI